jgi:hypothetical protein
MGVVDGRLGLDGLQPAEGVGHEATAPEKSVRKAGSTDGLLFFEMEFAHEGDGLGSGDRGEEGDARSPAGFGGLKQLPEGVDGSGDVHKEDAVDSADGCGVGLGLCEVAECDLDAVAPVCDLGYVTGKNADLLTFGE